MRPLLVAATLLLSLPLPALALDAKETGEMTQELEDREAAVRKQYGDRKLNQMTPEERREMDAKLRSARQEVLDKHGVDDRTYEKTKGKLGRDGLKQMEAAKKDYADRKAAEAKKAAESKGGEKQEGKVEVERGIVDEGDEGLGPNAKEIVVPQEP